MGYVAAFGNQSIEGLDCRVGQSQVVQSMPDFDGDHSKS